MEFFEGMTLRERIGGHETWGNKKNRDIGYALAANSCERVSGVDTCTVAVPDVISAFTVPNPGVPSQSSRFFRVWPSSGSPRPSNHPAYFRLATLLKLTLSAIDAARVAHPAKLSTPVFCAISSSATDLPMLHIARPSRLLVARGKMFLSLDLPACGNLFTGPSHGTMEGS